MKIFVCLTMIGLLLSPSQVLAATRMIFEDFEDNDFTDTFGAETSGWCSDMNNSQWVVTTSCTDDDQGPKTITPFAGSRFLAGNWNPNLEDDCTGNTAQAGNNRLNLWQTGSSHYCGPEYSWSGMGESFMRFYILLSGDIPMTAYNANCSTGIESSFKHLYQNNGPGFLCVAASVPDAEHVTTNGSWHVYNNDFNRNWIATAWDPPYANHRPPYSDKAWHKIEIYIEYGSGGQVKFWDDDVLIWTESSTNVGIPGSMGIMYNDSTLGFCSWDAPWAIDNFELYTDLSGGTAISSGTMVDGDIVVDSEDTPTASVEGCTIVGGTIQ